MERKLDLEFYLEIVNKSYDQLFQILLHRWSGDLHMTYSYVLWLANMDVKGVSSHVPPENWAEFQEAIKSETEIRSGLGAFLRASA